jgi:hypothetical protein
VMLDTSTPVIREFRDLPAGVPDGAETAEV